MCGKAWNLLLHICKEWEMKELLTISLSMLLLLFILLCQIWEAMIHFPSTLPITHCIVLVNYIIKNNKIHLEHEKMWKGLRCASAGGRRRWLTSVILVCAHTEADWMAASLSALHVTPEPDAMKCTCRAAHCSVLTAEDDLWRIFQSRDLFLPLLPPFLFFSPLCLPPSLLFFFSFVAIVDHLIFVILSLGFFFVCSSSRFFRPLPIPPASTRFSRWCLGAASPPSPAAWAEKTTPVAPTAPKRVPSTRSSTCRKQSALWRVRKLTTTTANSQLRSSKAANWIWGFSFFCLSVRERLEVLSDKQR